MRTTLPFVETTRAVPQPRASACVALIPTSCPVLRSAVPRRVALLALAHVYRSPTIDRVAACHLQSHESLRLQEMSARINVAIVAPSMGILGGHAVQAARLLRSWRHDPDVQAWLVPINPALPPILARAQRIKYLRTIVTQLFYWPLLVRELRRADIVHVFSASYWAFLLSAMPAVLVGKLFGKPVVLNYHSGQAPDHLRRSAIARAVLRSVERVVVPSPFLQGVFERFDIASHVVPNTIDTEQFPFRLRTALSPRMISVRNFEALYNLPCTLRAFRLVQDRYPDAELTLVGEGSQKPALHELVRKLGLDHVMFAGRVPPVEMPQYYADADVYLQTPDIDNMPLSILEAFASGCPVVSTDAGGVPVIVTDGVHGLLVPRNDHGAAANAVMRLLEDPSLATRLATAGHETLRRYQWPLVRSQWLTVYRGTAAAHGVKEATPA